MRKAPGSNTWRLSFMLSHPFHHGDPDEPHSPAADGTGHPAGRRWLALLERGDPRTATRSLYRQPLSAGGAAVAALGLVARATADSRPTAARRRLRHIARRQPAAVGHRHQPERCAGQRRLYHERRDPDGPAGRMGSLSGQARPPLLAHPAHRHRRFAAALQQYPLGRVALAVLVSGGGHHPRYPACRPIATSLNPLPPPGSPASSWR